MSGLYAALTVFVLAAPALASGLDTPPGVPDLPLNIEGVLSMCIAQPGTSCPAPNGVGNSNVGIGTTAPQAALQVSGGVLANNSSIVAGSACSPEGMIGYDLTHHEPVYCSSSAVWAVFNSAFMNRTWHSITCNTGEALTNNYSYPMDLVINSVTTTGHSYIGVFVNGTAIDYLDQAASTGYFWAAATVPPGETYYFYNNGQGTIWCMGLY